MGGFDAYACDVLDQRPSITRRIEPEYPPRARRMNIQGSVKVRLVVDASGQPCNCEVVSATPDGYFEEAALKAAKSMRFAPGKLKGQPVNTLVELPFIFRLR
ncbi:energy transducer TonB [uncultured Desulfovibrio sp.]|uniref:energy transducer TonB n=1 Tax=uncultured Desulfovibrio sp. TaxID=167968 RepID=UPI0025D692D8|nr:energy transducer TonB [uncultured Desulfovibrio sp.]